MARVIKTETLTPEMMKEFGSVVANQVYNGLDCMLTCEIADVLKPKVQADYNASLIYDFERALQAPFLEMMLRGFDIDLQWRHNGLVKLEARMLRLQQIINLYANAIWDRDLNPNSPKQLLAFFYDHMKLPPQFKRVKGVKKISCDSDALEALQVYFVAKPICKAIQKFREVNKLHGALNSGVDSDGRMRCSFNIAGTETGRLSSSENAFGSGTNFQNITQDLRRAFRATPGLKMGGSDLAQAESRMAGLLAFLASGQANYLDACESGDLHTVVTRMVRPELSWTGDAKQDKAVAEQKVPKDPLGKSYRDYSKNIGHGTNYLSKGFTLSKITGIPLIEVQSFQEAYFVKFPEIPLWHQWTATELQSNGYLISPMGRKRHFFDRLGDDATIRKAVAYSPQSSIADYMDYGIYCCWKDKDLRSWGFRLIAQVHDALYFEYPPENEVKVMERVLALLSPILSFRGRKFQIPTDAKVGWNWGPVVYDKKSKKPVDNLFGLKAWDGNADNRIFTETVKANNQMLDRLVR